MSLACNKNPGARTLNYLKSSLLTDSSLEPLTGITEKTRAEVAFGIGVSLLKIFDRYNDLERKGELRIRPSLVYLDHPDPVQPDFTGCVFFHRVITPVKYC